MHKMSEEVDEQKLIKSIKISNSLEFINNLSEGLKTNVGEKGLKLSGGQRQRVALARAIYTGKKFLIMDEPTSFQDKKGSKQIINNLIKIPNLTLIIISHSDYISNLFDKIYEIKNNIIVQK
jgi:ABC-type bacteriocin/lantibiotic exporter with double-glycine peptidase domain